MGGWGIIVLDSFMYTLCVCGSPGWKSNIISLCILSASPSLMCCSAKLLLGAGLIRATQTHKIFMRLHSAYEPQP